MPRPRTFGRRRISVRHYDRLLQGLQGLILRFQAIANDPATGTLTRARIEEVLKCADEVLDAAMKTSRVTGTR